MIGFSNNIDALPVKDIVLRWDYNGFTFTGVWYAGTWVKNFYTKVYYSILDELTEDSLTEDQEAIMFDKPIKGQLNRGLISLLVDALVGVGTKKIYLYSMSGTPVGVSLNQSTEVPKNGEIEEFEVDFSRYEQPRMLIMQALLLYDVFLHTYVSLRVGNTPQFAISNLDKSTSKQQIVSLEQQISSVGKGLINNGQLVYIDKDSEIRTTDISYEGTKEGANLVYAQIANITGFPLSYIEGSLGGGLGAIGEWDKEAKFKTLKVYLLQIFKPIVDAMLGTDIALKRDDYRMLREAKDLIPILENSVLIPQEEKLRIISDILGIDMSNVNEKEVNDDIK